jgi:hypothetical protein
MLRKEITCTDFNGNEYTEECYFNMTKAEVIEWLVTNGDYTYDQFVEQLAKKKDGKAIMRIFADLIKNSYGEKSLDGKRFMKSDEIRAKFIESNAYSELFTELITDAKKAAEFFVAIIPKDMSALVEGTMKENPDANPEQLREILQNKVVELPGTTNA